MRDQAYGAARRGVLVVEDHHLIAELLAEMLEELGHPVCGIACTEAAAVTAAADLRPALIIVDLRLGRGSGLAAMAEILRQNYVPHIYMSGDIQALTMACPTGVLLCKPFQPGDLQRCIYRATRAATPATPGQVE